MKTPELLDVDPRTLHVPPSRPGGADPYKLQRQIARFGAATVGMPEIRVYRGTDGVLSIYNGVTRATRIARLAPGVPVRVEVIREVRVPLGRFRQSETSFHEFNRATRTAPGSCGTRRTRFKDREFF